MYHGMDIDWEKMEEVARTVSSRDVLIGNAEEKVIEAAVKAQPAMRNDVLDGYAEFADLLTAVDELITLREGQ